MRRLANALWKADRRARKGAEQANSRDDQFDRNRWTSGPPWCLDQMMHQDGDSAEMNDLFDGIGLLDPPRENMAEGAVLLRGAALPVEAGLLAALADIVRVSPFRHMVTPGGYTMSVAMTNCGAVGWVTDRGGYRYGRTDPRTGNPWPLMPSCFLGLAAAAAAAAGYPGFDPDACLINRYEPGARLLLHQDKDELSFDDPIVSVSLGLPATFQFGGLKRKDPVKKYGLSHGDIAVWGGPSRLCYHGIAALKDGCHEILGRTRINLTFRRALGHGIQPIRKE